MGIDRVWLLIATGSSARVAGSLLSTKVDAEAQDEDEAASEGVDEDEAVEASESDRTFLDLLEEDDDPDRSETDSSAEKGKTSQTRESGGGTLHEKDEHGS